jgi:hypothetical protein
MQSLKNKIEQNLHKEQSVQRAAWPTPNEDTTHGAIFLYDREKGARGQQTSRPYHEHSQCKLSDIHLQL